MSLVFEALRREERPAPGPVTPGGSVLTTGPRRGRWWAAGGVLLLFLLLAGGFHWSRQSDDARVPPRSGQVQQQPSPAERAPTAETATALRTPAPGAGNTAPAGIEPATLTHVLSSAAPAQRLVVSSSRPRGVETAISQVTTGAPAVPSEPSAEAIPEPSAAATRVPSAAAEAPPGSRAPAAAVGEVAEAEQRPVERSEQGVPRVDGARLLALFNGAMARGDQTQAAELLDSARARLGDDHLLVARMEGYYCLRADCASRARRAYERVLLRLPDDREAGYNLALLELQAGQLKAAQERVGRLLQVYPGDGALRELQQVIRSRR